MNKSADILTSARYYDLKKKVFATKTTTTANHKSNDKEVLQQEDQEKTKTNSNEKSKSLFEAKILPMSEEQDKDTTKQEGTDLKLNRNTSNTRLNFIDTEQSSLKISNENSITTKSMSNSTPQQQAAIESKAATQTELIESDDTVKLGDLITFIIYLIKKFTSKNEICLKKRDGSQSIHVGRQIWVDVLFHA